MEENDVLDLNAYRRILRASPIAYAHHKMILDSDGKPYDYVFLEMNRAFEQMTGLSSIDLVNRSVREILPALVGDSFDWIAFFGSIAADGGDRSFERYSRALKRWFKGYAFSHQPGYFTTTFTDVTPEYVVEGAAESLHSYTADTVEYQEICATMQNISGASFAALNVMQDDGTSTVTVGLSGAGSSVEKATSILGFPIVGRRWARNTDWELQLAVNKTTVFRSLSTMAEVSVESGPLKLLEKSLRIGNVVIIKTMKGEQLTGTFCLIFKTGQQLRNKAQAEAYADMVGLLLGRIRAEIAEKHLRDDLKRNTERLNAFIAHTPAVIYSYTVGQSGLTRVSYVNDNVREVLGYAPDQFLDNTSMWTDLVHPEDEKQTPPVIPSSDKVHQYRVRDAAGNYHWIHDRRRVLWRIDGNTEVVGAWWEVNDLVAARRSAEAANKAKSEFLANMSHEIRTPLNGILGTLQLLQNSSLSTDQRDNLHIALGSTKRLTQLLSDILDLSKIESGKLSIRSDIFRPKELLASVVELFAVTAQEKDLHLSWSSAEFVPEHLIGDELRIRQVLFNLVGNAIKFTDKGSVHLSMTGAPDQESYVFEVVDSGSGLSRDEIDRLFEPFYQVERSYTRTQVGAGLGLSIVKRLVALMNGSIEFHSTPGSGTRVTVELPLSAAAMLDQRGETHAGAAPLKLSDPEFGGHQPIDKLKILLAEDDRMNQLVFRRLLEKQGYEVTCVGNGRLAFEATRQKAFDVVLMDIQMPEMNGMDATREIRGTEGNEASRRVPIIALTAHAMPEDLSEFLDCGMDLCVTKPVTIEDLQHAFQELNLI